MSDNSKSGAPETPLNKLLYSSALNTQGPGSGKTAAAKLAADVVGARSTPALKKGKRGPDLSDEVNKVGSKSLIQDHDYRPRNPKEPWGLCVCGLAEAAHSESAEPYTF